MRTFPAAFLTELAKKTGSKPVWIIKHTVNSTDYFIAGRVLTIPEFTSCAPWPVSTEVTTVAWLQSLGTIGESITGGLREVRLGDFSVSYVVDPDAATNMETLIQDDIEEESTELYFWYEDCTAAPQLVFTGYSRDNDLPTETQASETIEDVGTKIANTYIGTKIDLTTFPLADPADIGKIIPILYGTLEKVPACCVQSYYCTTLAADVGTGDSTITVSDATDVVNGYWIADGEEVLVTGKTGNVLNVTRAAPVTHTAGAIFRQKLIATSLAWLAADHAVDSISKVQIKLDDKLFLDITSSCDLYTGATGDEHPSFPGRACVEMKKYIDTGTVSPVAMDTYWDVVGSCIGTITDMVDGNTSTYITAYPGAFEIKYRRAAAYSNSNYPSRIRMALYHSAGVSSGYAYVYIDGTLRETVTIPNGVTGWVYSNWLTITDWASVNNAATYVHLSVTVNTALHELCWEIEYGIPLSNSILDQTGAKSAILVDCSRTITTTNIFNDILTRAGRTANTAVIGAIPAAYTLNGAITEYKTAASWLNAMAWQLGCYYRFNRGVSNLIVRTLTLTIDRTISACKVGSDGRKVLSRQKTDTSNLINTINLLYNRDWSVPKSDTAYKSKYSPTPDSTSIGKYGVCEQPDLFQCDFITSDTHASDLAAFYLAKYKDRLWRYTFTTFIDQLELEFGDAVHLDFSASFEGEIIETRISPGNAKTLPEIEFIVEGAL